MSTQLHCDVCEKRILANEQKFQLRVGYSKGTPDRVFSDVCVQCFDAVDAVLTARQRLDKEVK